jgi:hypothetical protein
MVGRPAARWKSMIVNLQAYNMISISQGTKQLTLCALKQNARPAAGGISPPAAPAAGLLVQLGGVCCEGLSGIRVGGQAWPGRVDDGVRCWGRGWGG